METNTAAKSKQLRIVYPTQKWKHIDCYRYRANYFKSRQFKRNQMKNKIMCKFYEPKHPGEKCRRYRCNYAHTLDERKIALYKNKYQSCSLYKEEKCPQLDKCPKIGCKFYHEISEKRVNIAICNLKKSLMRTYEQSELNKVLQKQKKGWKYSKDNLDVSEVLIRKSRLEDGEIQEICQIIWELRGKLERNKEINQEELNKIKKISVNLISTESVVKGKDKLAFMNALHGEFDDILFKSKELFYERISQKKQLSIIVNDPSVVGFVCSELKRFQPCNLKLFVKSTGKNWKLFCELMKAVGNSGGSLRKLELIVSEVIGPRDVMEIQEQLKIALGQQNNFKVLKLKLEFNYLKKNGEYERDIADVCVDSIKEFHRDVEIQLILFGMKIIRKRQELFLGSEPMRRNKLKNRQSMNERLKYHWLQMYFFDKFMCSVDGWQFSRLKFDFSSNYGLVKEEVMRSLIAKQYIASVKAILRLILRVLEAAAKNSVDILILKFFSFDFKFESSAQRKASIYSFYSAYNIPQQNQSILEFHEFNRIVEVARDKISNKFIYQIFQGNLFRPKQYLKEFNPKRDPWEYRYKSNYASNLTQNIALNSNFLSRIMHVYKDLREVIIPKEDATHLSSILRMTHNLIDAKLSPGVLNRTPLVTTVEKNNMICIFRRKVLLVIQLFRVQRKKYPEFFFRQEIVMNILKIIGLEIEGFFKELDEWSMLRQKELEITKKRIIDQQNGIY